MHINTQIAIKYNKINIYIYIKTIQNFPLYKAENMKKAK